MASFDITELNKSSFRGLPFFTKNTSLTGGKRITDHNFINGGNEAEDNGLKNKTFKVVGYLVGEDYKDNKDELIKAFDTLGSGILVEKFYGTIEVEVDTYIVKESTERLGIAEIEINFKKSINELVIEDLIVYNINYKPEIISNFKQDFDNELGEDILGGMANGIAALWNGVLDTIKFLEDAKGELNNIKSQIGRTISTIKTAILSIETLADDILNILDSFDDILDIELFTAEDKKSFSNGIRELLNDSVLASPSNEALIKADRQLKTYTNTVIAGLAQIAIQNIENVDFDTGDDFGSVKDDLLFIFETLSEDVIIDPSSTIIEITNKQNLIDKYHQARSSFIFFYTQKYSGIQPLKDVEITATTNAYGLTIDLYNDIGRVSEVLINNDIIDPFFINGNLKLLDR